MPGRAEAPSTPVTLRNKQEILARVRLREPRAPRDHLTVLFSSAIRTLKAGTWESDMTVR